MKPIKDMIIGFLIGIAIGVFLFVLPALSVKFAKPKPAGVETVSTDPAPLTRVRVEFTPEEVQAWDRVPEDLVDATRCFHCGALTGWLVTPEK